MPRCPRDERRSRALRRRNTPLHVNAKRTRRFVTSCCCDATVDLLRAAADDAPRHDASHVDLPETSTGNA